MAVEVYKGRLFQHGHERRALGRFLQILKSKFGDSDELYIVVIEVDANGAAIDLLLIGPSVLIIADLKELTAASENDAKSVQITGKANGSWEYLVPEKVVTDILGGADNVDKNPYKQIDRMRYKFADWLSDKWPLITGENWEKDEVLDHLCGWAVLSPGFDGNIDHLELPWGEIKKKHNWFKVLSLEQLAWEFHCTTDSVFELTEREMHTLVDQLGATKVTNWGEILPDYFPTDLPPIPIGTGFTPLPLLNELIGRDDEILQLMCWVDDPSIAIIGLRGMGGIGKTSTLERLAKVESELGWQYKYVACREKELTAETFLALVASGMDDHAIAHFILDKEIKLVDRLDVALNRLEEKHILLMIDDFQKVTAVPDISQILQRIPAHSTGLKAIIVSRDHPDVIDDPKLPFGVVRELLLEGLSKEVIPAFFEKQQDTTLDQDQIDWVWERTSGNPYAIGLIKPLINKYGWNETVTQLPLYENDKNHWFESLIETLDKDARQLAYRISVIRTTLTSDMITHLCHDPVKAEALTFELTDKFIIQKLDQNGRFSIHDFIREYLYDHFPDTRQRTKSHQDAGTFYKNQGEKAVNDYEMGDAFYEAIYHFEQAGQEEEILRLAPDSFLSLDTHGDWDRAQFVATKALKAARSKNRPLEISRWLVNIANWEFYHDQIDVAEKDLQRAYDQLPKREQKMSDADRKVSLQTEAQILSSRGRIAYHGSDFDQAKEYYSKALSIIKEIQDDSMLAGCLLCIARIERHKGDFEASRSHFEEARQIAHRINDHNIIIQAVSHLALVARQENDNQKARQYFTEAYEYAKEIDDWRGMEINQSLLADLARREGDYSTAAEIFQNCLVASRQIGNGVSIRINLGQLAESLIRMGRLEEAVPLLSEAEDRCQNAGDGIGIAWTLMRKGLLVKNQGDLAGGDQLILQGIAKLREIGSEIYIQDFEKELGPVQNQ